MRRTLSTTALPAVLVGALLLSACGDQDRATFDEGKPVQQAEAAARTTSEPTPTTGAPVASAVEGAEGLVPVEWPDAPRELTDIEKEFLYEPGPFAGDSYDEDAVVEAVVAQHPSTLAEWEEAVRAQLQEDLADDLRTAITFDPRLGETGAEPTEGAAPPASDAVGTNHFALVLDASGSMAAASGSGTRMDEAKAAITTFVGALPPGSSVSLRVYGHEGDNTTAGKKVSCRSTETVYEGPADSDTFVDRLESVRPTGWTPLAAAITAAEDDIPQEATDGIVYVVTDGLETCGGDPVAAAQDLADSGVKPIVNVIGFQTEGADEAALRAIAEAGGGDYTHADSQAELEKYWDEEYSRMMAAWDEWKNTELSRIEEEGSAKMEDAEEVGNRLMERSERQGDRAMQVAERLGADGHLDYDEKTDLWSSLYKLKRDMWAYAYEAKRSNWSASYEIKREAWSDVYDKGRSTWSEYYAKTNG